MKRTYPVNIDGQIFYIDEDAYQLLNNYLEQLRITFTGAEGAEIVSDIESRIREHFTMRANEGAGVIVIADVNKVIETMGRPEDLSENEETNAGDAPRSQSKNDHNEWPFSISLPKSKRLYRNMDNKIFGGVFGGLAMYLGWNANIMRLLYAVLTCVSYFWPFTIIYLLAWMIIPPAITPKQILEMRGEPVSVDTLGQAVMAGTPTPPPYYGAEEKNFFTTVFGIIGKCLMGFLALIAGAVSFGSLIGALTISAGAVGMGIFHNAAILSRMGFDMHPNMLGLALASIFALLFIVVLFGSIAWGATAIIFHTKGLGKTGRWTVFILSIMLLVAAIVLFGAFGPL